MFRIKDFIKSKSTVLIAAALLTACGSSPLGPDGRFEVSSAADNFLFRMWTLENANDIRTYNWENTGTQATVDISQGISTGSVILTIHDAGGTQVHQSDVADDIDTETAIGVAGFWTIEVRLTSVTGSFDISVIKKD